MGCANNAPRVSENVKTALSIVRKQKAQTPVSPAAGHLANSSKQELTPKGSITFVAFFQGLGFIVLERMGDAAAKDRRETGESNLAAKKVSVFYSSYFPSLGHRRLWRRYEAADSKSKTTI